MATMTVTNGDPFQITLSGAEVRGGTVVAEVEAGSVPPGGQLYYRSEDGWVLAAGGETTRHEGAGSGNQVIATIPYEVGDGPDVYNVEVVANLVGSTSSVGSFILNGAAGRDNSGASSPFTASRSDTIPRGQSLVMGFSGSNLVIQLNNSVLTSLEWKATVTRKRKSNF